MKFVDFGAFQIKMQIPSHEKILLQMLIGAFHITSRILQSYTRDLRPALIDSLGSLDKFRNH